MSGPKTSQYTLTPEQRRQLELQRKVRAELALLAEQKKHAVGIQRTSDDLIHRAQLLAGENPEARDLLQRASRLKAQLEKTMETVTRMEETTPLETLQDLGKEFSDQYRQLEDINVEISAAMDSLETAFRGNLGKKLADGFQLDFGTAGKGGDPKVIKLRKELEALFSQAEKMHLSEELRAGLAQARSKAAGISDPEFLRNFRTMSAAPLMDRCRAYHELYEAQKAEYQQKLWLYRENCRILEQIPREIPFGPGALEDVEMALQRTEADISFREEQAYISRCMDEAMEELGYSLLGDREVVKRSGKKFRNALYLFDEGTAVNVTFAENGQITMELGGMDDCDRLPTDRERRALVREMDEFCGDFHALEQMLKKKGITAKRLSILPSHEQYAQIINVSDYRLQTQVRHFRVKPGTESDAVLKRRKAGE